MQTLSDHLCMHMESLKKCRGHFSLLPYWLRDEAHAVLAGEAQVPGILDNGTNAWNTPLPPAGLL